jgi:hypothetical protein
MPPRLRRDAAMPRCLPLATTSLLLLMAAGGIVAQAAERVPRYAAILTSGQRLEGSKLGDWHDERAMPRLDGKPLLEASAPLRWLRDRSQPLAELPPAYVEFTSGDRLPGIVVDYRSGLEDPYQPLPPHLVVRVALEFEPPGNRPVAEIRVLAHFVRRIVWQGRSRQPYQPGTVLYRDGRTVPFRALRQRPGAVHLLLAEGDRQVPWNDLAEIHFPQIDPWAAWFDELALLCPTAETRLIELETSAGLVATASLARWAPRFEGNSSDADRWVHGVQPAWSLDILWIPFRQIAYYRSFATHELPLTRIAPQTIVYRGGLAGTRGAQLNRNVLGTPLRSRTLDFGFGFGVSGGTELSFDLSPHVRALQARVCLDRAAGSGGCIRPRILAGEAGGQVLWEGPVMVGSDAIADTGTIALPDTAGPRRSIVLQIDPVLEGKPAGADPLDIRDHANWCDPVLELDPAAVERELTQRLAQRLALDRGWTAEPLAGTLAEAGLEITSHRHESVPGWFAPAVQVKEQPLVLRRELTIDPRDRWLIVAAVRPKHRRDETRIEVRIGGEPVGAFVVPQGQDNPHDDRPLAISLAGPVRDKPLLAQVEIRQLPDSRNSAVHYRAILPARQLPTLHELLDDDAAMEPLVPGQAGAAELTSDDRYSGARALRVTPDGQFRLPLETPLRIRERPNWDEVRLLRLAVKKQGGGRVAFELDDAQPRTMPARYDLGEGEPAYGHAKRVHDRLPQHWVVITRDLYADFGNIDLRGIVVGCPDGDAALIDHVYLARNHADFEQVPAAPSPELVNAEARRALVQPLFERVRPACVRIAFADGGQAAGVLVHDRGEILTVGRAFEEADQPCLVTLADGTTVSARTRGVAREFDVGLVQLEGDARYPKLEIRGGGDLQQNQPYLAMVFPLEDEEFQPPRAEVVAIRRVLPASVWTDLETGAWLAGGAIVDRDGRVVGLQLSRSQFGGVLGNRLHAMWSEMPRLRSGEAFGTWPRAAD